MTTAIRRKISDQNYKEVRAKIKANPGKWYVYAHYMGGELIYIGKGRGKRALQDTARNDIWNNRMGRIGRLVVCVWEFFDDSAAAIQTEAFLIWVLRPIANKKIPSRGNPQPPERNAPTRRWREGRTFVSSPGEWMGERCEDRAEVDLQKHCKSLIKQHGTARAAGDMLGIDYAYLHRMSSGKQTSPSDETLEKLGLSRVVKYYLRDC